MEAAERIFDGSFDHVGDEDEDVEIAPAREKPKASRMIVSLVRILYRRAILIPPRRPKEMTMMTMN